MKTALISLIIAFSILGFSIPAYPGIITLIQPDGSTIYARQIGDEYAHLMLYEGKPIVKNPETGWWEFANIKDDKIISTGLKPGKDRSFSIHKSKIESYLAAAIRPKKHEKSVPTSGIVKFPVILINFSDTATSFEAADFDELFNGVGYSVKDYYLEVSGGVIELQFTVIGWFNASKTHDYYGENDIWGYDKHPQELVSEAIIAADPYLDYSEFDNDGNGSVDAVIVVHQGNGEEASGNPTDIWSHQFYAPTSTDDGVTASKYTIQPETLFDDINTIGVICHELGHIFGLIDLYDTDYSSDGIGNWGLMGTGSWNGLTRPGDSPAHFSGWSLLKLSWVSETNLNGYIGEYTFKPVETNRIVYTFDNPDRKNIEYFLMENRRKIGYDTALPGEGLIIYHIDEMANQSDDTHRKVDVEEADGDNALDYYIYYGNDRGSSGDPFPGSSNNTAFAQHTNPDSKFYDGFSLLKLTSISEFASDITGVLSSGIIRKEPDPYLTYGTTETLIYEFYTPIATYTITSPPGIVQFSQLTEEGKKLEIAIVPPAEIFNLKLDVIDATAVYASSELEFLPFAYIIVPDGVSASKFVLIKPLGWDESPGLDWNSRSGYYWKWVETLPITAYGKEIPEE
ncbi:hypothetical protein AT15_08105 [Kosmotoga arenicorallina S304]|uniref:Peptidase M6-like domain-containing protein n=1 Tax=Kosmotoga arenicorallina S304 TaxID=1453497 RepID=A0A182C7E9_9BACT|nr:M6 family metalloprotease domain-containing protein [Kosmotoga arenicorallina]OAA31447.1 hypothetical protein AT15_08105 [Kosmotoga arenicorallina S304]